MHETEWSLLDNMDFIYAPMAMLNPKLFGYYMDLSTRVQYELPDVEC